MRHRRAQRCLLRAEIALEAGFADDAREALEEARRLGAPSEDVARIDAQIAAATVPAPTSPPTVIETVVPPRLSWKFVATAIIVMALAAALAGVVVLRQPPNLFYSSTPAEPAPQILGNPEPAAPHPAAAVAEAVQKVPPASTDGRALGTAGAEPVQPATADTAAAGSASAPPEGGEPASSEPIVVQRQTVAVPVTQTASLRETTSVPPEARSSATTTASGSTRPASPASVSPASAPPSSSAPPPSTPPASASTATSDLVALRAAPSGGPVVVTRATPLERVDVDPVPDVAAPSPPAPPPVSMPINTTAAAVPPPTTAAPTAPVRDESIDVRAVLTRYETAYSELDPSQARAVWPGVDERALSRAFSGLASQRVSLGRCDVTMNGATARATCAGSATWTPKVGGGGARTEARRWTFELAKSGDGWKIAKALVR